MLHVIGIVGMPGAGKSSCIEHLQRERGAKVVNMGDMVREQVTKAGLAINPDTLGKMAEELRKKRGLDVVAQLTAEKVSAIAGSDDLVIIDGLRSMQEVAFFRKRWRFPVLAVHSPPRVRHQRLLARQRADDSSDPEYYAKREARELKFGIAEVIVLADEMIVNSASTTEQELQAMAVTAIDRLLQEAGQ
nr:AAA family ATPase [Candidatus Sigynarchaeota archaeon]